MVSIITVVLNNAAGLQRTMDSVAAQDYASREYIVVDGASTDGTQEVLRRRSSEIARWISEPDAGIYQAMNKGARMAAGAYLCFLNAGDRFASDKALTSMFVPSPRTELLWGDCIIETRRGEEYASAREVLKRLHRRMPVCHQSLFVRRDALLGRPFNESLRIAADYEFLCDRLLAGAGWEYRALPVSRINDTGVSAQLFRIDIREKRLISLARFPTRRLSTLAWYVVYESYMILKNLLGR